jgi:hypothetical protein
MVFHHGLGVAIHRLYFCANLRPPATPWRLARALSAPDSRHGLCRLRNRCCIQATLKHVANPSYHHQSGSGIFSRRCVFLLVLGATRFKQSMKPLRKNYREQAGQFEATSACSLRHAAVAYLFLVK